VRALDLPEAFAHDIEKAISILKAEGSSEIYLFGSLCTDEWTENSDIDLATRGIKAESFFSVYSRIGRELEHDLDLIDLDHELEFAQFLMSTNRLVKIA
jgi:predicted nucleotidyltransferase